MTPSIRRLGLPRVSILAILLLVTTPWWPHDADAGGAARPVRLREALTLAGEHSPVLSASRYGMQAADAQQTVARGAYMPKLEASETWTRTNNPTLVFGTLLNQGRFTGADFSTSTLNSPSSLENFRSRISVLQPVYNGGREGIGVRMADLGRSISAEGLEQSEQEVAFLVTHAYYDVLLAKATLAVARETVQIAEANLQSIQARFDAGATVKADLLQAEVRLSSHREDVIRADQALRVANTALQHAIGLDEPVEAAGRLTEEAAPPPALDAVVEQALKSRHDYRQMVTQIERSQAGVDLAKSSYLPMFNLQASYERNNTAPFSENGANNYIAMGVVSINLFNGLSDLATVRKARAEQQQARKLVVAMRRRIEVEVVRAYYGLAAARERLTVTAQSVAQARENLRIMRNRYKGGISPVLDLLTAEFVLNEAKQNRLRAVYDTHLGLAQLAFVSGRLGL